MIHIFVVVVRTIIILSCLLVYKTIDIQMVELLTLQNIRCLTQLPGRKHFRGCCHDYHPAVMCWMPGWCRCVAPYGYPTWNCPCAWTQPELVHDSHCRPKSWSLSTPSADPVWFAVRWFPIDDFRLHCPTLFPSASGNKITFFLTFLQIEIWLQH